MFAVPLEGFQKWKTIEQTSLNFYSTRNRVWWCLVPTNGVNLVKSFSGHLNE
jgi:hypothetical protein